MLVLSWRWTPSGPRGTRQDRKSLKESSGVCISSDTITFSLCSNGMGRSRWKKKNPPREENRHVFAAPIRRSDGSSGPVLTHVVWKCVAGTASVRNRAKELLWWLEPVPLINREGKESRWLAPPAFDSYGSVVGLSGGMSSHRTMNPNEMGSFFPLSPKHFSTCPITTEKKQHSRISLPCFWLRTPLTLVMATEPGSGATTRFCGFSAVSSLESPPQAVNAGYRGVWRHPGPRCHRPNAIICIIPSCIIESVCCPQLLGVQRLSSNWAWCRMPRQHSQWIYQIPSYSCFGTLLTFGHCLLRKTFFLLLSFLLLFFWISLCLRSWVN